MNNSIPEEKRIPEILFAELADRSEDGIYITNEDGLILFVNDMFCKIAQKRKDELIDLPFYTIYHDSESVRLMESHRRTFEDDWNEKYSEQRHTLWNGHPIWLEHQNLIWDRNDQKKVVISFIRDISSRKFAELEHIDGGIYYKMLFTNISDGILVNHLTADKTFGNFIDANNRACSLLNYARDELLNLGIYNIVSIRDRQKIEELTARLADEQSLNFEIDLLTKNGPRVPVEINARLSDYRGESVIISVVRDITERSQAHKKLSKSREQLRSLALRLQNIREEERALIAREIHDELGQLLTVLKIQISLIGKKLADGQKELMQKIQSSINFIDQAVDSVQKITAKLRPGILDDLGLIPAIEWQAQEFEQRTGIHCECSLPKETIDLQPDHSTALFRITQEALTNVARHSFAERASIYLKKENNKLILEITDNGKGIHDSQVNNPNSLGLLGIKERAMVFGGKVTIYGVSNRGTNLKVEWPLKKS